MLYKRFEFLTFTAEFVGFTSVLAPTRDLWRATSHLSLISNLTTRLGKLLWKPHMRPFQELYCETTTVESAGIARERLHREAVGQVENPGGKGFVGHVRRPAVGQTVCDDDQSRRDAGEVQRVSDVGQGAGGVWPRSQGHAEPSD